MTPQQIRDAIAADQALTALAANRSHDSIAAILSSRQPSITRSLRVDELFDVLFDNGDYLTLKQAELAGDIRAVMAFAALKDARTLGPGTVNLSLPATTQMLDSLQAAPALITQQSRDLIAAASVVRPADITGRQVADALSGA